MENIRPAEAGDFEAIREVSEHLGYELGSSSAAAFRLNLLLESETDEVLVFEEEGTIKGWIHLFEALRAASDPFAEIGGMVVARQYQRKGIGSKLMQAARYWAAERQMKLRVRCSSERKETHKFFQAQGFGMTKTQLVFDLALKDLV